MKKRKRFAIFSAALSAVAVVLVVAAGVPRSALAQQSSQGVERKILMRQDLSMPGWESVMTQTTIQPGGTEGWHTHPGTLVEYVLQGPWTMERRGKPTGRTKPAKPSPSSKGKSTKRSTQARPPSAAWPF